MGRVDESAYRVDWTDNKPRLSIFYPAAHLPPSPHPSPLPSPSSPSFILFF